MGDKKEILILYTGGTIGMHKDSDGLLRPMQLEKLKKLLPEIERFELSIDWKSVGQPKDSSDLNSEDWSEFAEIITENKSLYQGFLVLHGTDTMAYTASVLSFLLIGLVKPVILTGAQLSIDNIRSDAKENLINSLSVLKDCIDKKIDLKEVCICFGQHLLRGNRSSKEHNHHFEAFESNNFPSLAHLGTYIEYKKHHFLNDQYKIEAPIKFSQGVVAFKFFPGLPENLISDLFNIDRYKIIVLESFGAGNLPYSPFMVEKIGDFVKDGGLIYKVSQSAGARGLTNHYTTGDYLDRLGVIHLGDMTMEAAYTKALVFGKDKNLMLSNLCGEIEG